MIRENQAAMPPFITLPLALAGMWIAANGCAAEANMEAGKKKAAEVCSACHGADGNSVAPDFPRLAGQHEDYLIESLRKYKNGQRANAIMKGFAAMLSEQGVRNIAAYYARQKGLYLKY